MLLLLALFVVGGREGGALFGRTRMLHVYVCDFSNVVKKTPWWVRCKWGVGRRVRETCGGCSGCVELWVGW